MPWWLADFRIYRVAWCRDDFQTMDWVDGSIELPPGRWTQAPYIRICVRVIQSSPPLCRVFSLQYRWNYVLYGVFQYAIVNSDGEMFASRPWQVSAISALALSISLTLIWVPPKGGFHVERLLGLREFRDPPIGGSHGIRTFVPATVSPTHLRTYLSKICKKEQIRKGPIKCLTILCLPNPLLFPTTTSRVINPTSSQCFFTPHRLSRNVWARVPFVEASQTIWWTTFDSCSTKSHFAGRTLNWWRPLNICTRTKGTHLTDPRVSRMLGAWSKGNPS
jgi:hypothetical protein